MGFPGVVPEHVPGTLGEHDIFPVPCSLFPVPCSLKDSPPPKKKIVASGGPGGRLVTCSLFPVPCSHKTPLREHVFRVPCSLSPYGKTHPWYSQVSESLSTVDIDRDRSTGRLKSNRPIDDTCANLILRFPIPPGKAFFRWTWDCILLPKNWVS